MKWIKASEKQPEDWSKVLVRAIGDLHPFISDFTPYISGEKLVMVSYEAPDKNYSVQQIEWLDESADSEHQTLQDDFERYGFCKAVFLSKLDWTDKYDRIFSGTYKPPFTWYDPDANYEDDVKAFMDAFDNHMKGFIEHTRHKH